MRQAKGNRKKASYINRLKAVDYLRGKFQKAFNEAQGEPQSRLEAACLAVDQEMKTWIAREPHNKGFFLLVISDFKKYLLNLEKNAKVVQDATKEPVIEDAELVKA